MNPQSIIIPIDSNTNIETLTSKIQNPSSTYTLFLPTKKTTPKEYEVVKSLCDQLSIPPENHLTINVSSIVQKTWRIIHHYSTNETIPAKNSPQRSKAIKRLAELHHKRLDQIEIAIKDMLIKDQATKLEADVIYP